MKREKKGSKTEGRGKVRVKFMMENGRNEKKKLKIYMTIGKLEGKGNTKDIAGKKDREDSDSVWNVRHVVKVFKGTRRWGNKKRGMATGDTGRKEGKKDIAIEWVRDSVIQEREEKNVASAEKEKKTKQIGLNGAGKRKINNCVDVDNNMKEYDTMFKEKNRLID